MTDHAEVAGITGSHGVVTGAGSGIGREIALAAARAGAHVTALDLSQAGLDTTLGMAGAAASRITVRCCDVADADQIAAALAPRLDATAFLANVAGIEGSMARLPDVTVEDWDRVMAVNTRSVFLTMRAVLPVMARAGKGSIVNIASVAALGGAGELAAYTASKHAVLGLTRVAVAEFAGMGVRINALCPGPIDTPLQERAERGSPDPAQFRTRQQASIPQGRYGLASEVADAVLFLLSDRAAYINGAAVSIDGGMTATLN